MIAALVAALVAMMGATTHASWKPGQGCAYFPVRIDDYSLEGSTVKNIREILDGHGRTIGVIYVGEDGRFAIQGNPLMGDDEAKRFGLPRVGVPPFWTGIGPVKLAEVRRPVIECRRDHMMRFPASSTRVNADAGFAYAKGRSYTPDPLVDLHP
jgi:hypothetical protein